MSIQEILALLGVQEIVTLVIVIVVILSGIVEVSKIKINPWSWIAAKFGRAANAEVTKDLGEIKKKLEDHITADDRRTADAHRARILHFNNELLRDIPHTKEEFIEVLTDIDAYDSYCRENPDYPNNRAVLAIENIRDSYKERLRKRDFLQESSAVQPEETS